MIAAIRDAMARLLLLLCVGAALTSVARAIYEDEVGTMDWRRENIGAFQAVHFGGKRAVVSSASALAELTTRSGDIHWRFVLPEGAR